MAGLTLRQRIARLHPFVWIGAAAAVAALVAWPLGGWDTVELESTKIPQVDPGTLVEGQQYSIRVESAELTDVHPDGYSEPEPGWQYLILATEFTNMTAETQLSLYLGDDGQGSLVIDDGALGQGSELIGPDDYVVRGDPYLIVDGTFLPELQPRLPAGIDLVFDVPTDLWSVGDRMTIGIVDREPYERLLSTGTGYRNARVTAEVEVVVEQGEQRPVVGDETADADDTAEDAP